MRIDRRPAPDAGQAAPAVRPPTRFVPVRDVAGLDDWLPLPGVAVLFLHDPGCGGSRRAHAEVARVGGAVALLDVRAAPALAGEVARRTKVRHESPQVLVLRDGWVAWHASHAGVTEQAVAGAVAAARGGADGGG